MLKNFKSLFIFSIVFIFVSIFSLKAEIIKEVTIDGNNRVSDETILIYGGINLNEDINDDKLNLILNNLYSTEFFENVNVKIINQTLIIKLKEYPIVNQIIFIGEKSNRIKDEVKKVMKLKEKKSYIKSYLSKDIDIIKKLYSSIGFNIRFLFF